MATAWTNRDLAELTSKAMELLLADDIYCEYCLVVPIQEGDKYCTQCANEIVEALAVRFNEQSSINQGWY